MANPKQPDAQASDVVEHGSALILVTAGVLAATLMQTLDTTIVNVALPIIQGNLGATIDQGAWIVTGYIISAVVIIPLTPWLQQRFGRRQYYATAIIGFTIASAFCGISSSINGLIFWRVIQGLFGGGLVATAQATLRDTFPKDKLGASQAVFALGAVVGPSIGPTLGGWLTDNFSWNWVFFINLVPGTFAAIVILTRLKNPTEPRVLPIDGIGLGLLALGLGSLQYILDEGQRNDWFSDPLIVLFSATAIVGVVAFCLWELFGTKNPVVDLRALKYRAVAAGAALGFTIGATLFGAIVILPQYTQGILGFTATESGELIFTRAIFIAIFTPPVAAIAGRGKIDTRILLTVGFTMIGIGQFWLAHVTTSLNDFGTLAPPSILGGMGLALVFVPISIAVLGALPPQIIPKATAFQSLSLQLGGSISTAALVTLLARRNAFHQEALASNATMAFAPVASLLSNGAGSLNSLYAGIVRQASVLSYADAQFSLGVLTFTLMPLILLIPKRRKENTKIEAPAD